MITVVITSCGRWDKLKKTFDSFMKFNTLPVKEVIIIEDSSSLDGFPVKGHTLIFNGRNIGQVESIDRAYHFVKTPYIFHIENDWEFYREGFMEKSLTILENNPKIMQVWLRDRGDVNNHPIDDEVFTSCGVDYSLVSINAHGGVWHGFTWNPGLRRLSDYKLIAPFIQYKQEKDFNALAECRVGQKFHELGFRAAILMDGYVKHIV